MRLRNPNRKSTPPGAILREDVLPALGMTLRMQEALDLWELNRAKASEYAGIERLAA